MTSVKISDKVKFRSNNLVFIKFAAAMMVIWGHAISITNSSLDPISWLSKQELSLGSVAVAVFFFASGFYVTKSMEKTKSAKEYFVKRILRIYPSFVLMMLFTVFVLGPIVTTLPISEYFSSKDTYAYLLYVFMVPKYALPGVFVNNPLPLIVNGSLWTLILEMICYICLYIAFSLKLLEKTTLKKLNIILLICIFGIFGLKIPSLYLIRSYLRPMFVFIIGMEYYVYRDKIILDLKYLLAVIGIGLISVFVGYGDIFTILGLPYLLCWFIFNEKQICTKAANVGEVSYEMYLVAFPIQQTLICFFTEMGVLTNIVVTIILSFCIGHVLKRISEYAVQKLR